MAVTINKGRALSTLSLTPLIDVVFLLLIFFLVATRFEEEERSMEIELAQSSESLPLVNQPKTIFINVTMAGEYKLAGNQAFSPQELEDFLREHNTQPVVIRPDLGVRHEIVVAAHEICRRVGIRDVKEAVNHPDGGGN